MRVAYEIASNIVSPLGSTTAEVVDNVLNGRSGVENVEGFSSCEPLCAAMLDKNLYAADQNHTRFEKLAIASITEANQTSKLDLSSNDVMFFLSTTKGNIELLESDNEASSEDLMLWRSAEKIAVHFGNRNTPVVVSNACISGVSALITAERYLKDAICSHAVVVGCDLVTKFVVSGFQSFKALSEQRCKPFDRDRVGLNLGEAAATMILGVEELDNLQSGVKCIKSGAISNDSNHISAPSRTAEGLFGAIGRCDIGGVGYVVAHGTATPYNDGMEAIALQRAGIEQLPVFSLKGYFGHTLGAAGLLETIVGSELLDRGELPASLGFENLGVEGELNVVSERQRVDTKAFLKTISGFGGCNAALVVGKL